MARSLNLDLLFSTVVTGLSAGLNFLVQMAIVRWFGVATFGAFSFWRNNIYIAGSIGRFGLQGLALKQVSHMLELKDGTGISRFYRFALSAWLVTSAFVITGFLLSGYASKSGDYDLLFALVSLVLAGMMIGVAIFRVIGSLRLSIVLDRIFIMGFFLIAIGIAVASGDTSNRTLFLSFTTSVIFGFLLTLVAVFISHKRRVSALVDHDSQASWRAWWRSGWSFFMLALGNILAQRSTLLIAGLYLGTLELGRLAFMIMLAGLISLPLQALNQVAAPNIARLSARQEYAAVKSIIAKTKLFSVALGVLAALVIYFGYGIIESLVAKSDLVDPTVLGLLLFAMVVNAYFGPVGTALSMVGREKSAAVILNVMVALKIVALLIVVPAYSLLGLAVVEIIFTFSWNFGMEWKLRDQLNIWSNQSG